MALVVVDSYSAMSWQQFWRDESGECGLRQIPYRLWQAGGVPPGVAIGDLLRSKGHMAIRRHLSQSAFYQSEELGRKHGAHELSAENLLALESVQEVLERGELTLAHPRVAESLLHAIPSLQQTVTLEHGAFRATDAASERFHQAAFSCVLDASRGADSDCVVRFEDEFSGRSAERAFWDVIRSDFPLLGPFLHPQVLLSNLIEAEPEDDRRADFVIALRGQEGTRGLIVEIHGNEKSEIESEAQGKARQGAKRRDLEQSGWAVLDISRSEVLSKKGPWLDRIRKMHGLLQKAHATRDAHEFEVEAINYAWLASQVDLLVLSLTRDGVLGPRTPHLLIQVEAKALEIAQTAGEEITQLIDSLQRVWGVSRQERVSAWLEIEVNELQSTASAENRGGCVRASIDPMGPAYLPVKEKWSSADLHVRRIFLPVGVARTGRGGRRSRGSNTLPRVPLDVAALEEVLIPLVQRVMWKEKLRPKQADGVLACLQGKSRLLLMPTGHGKSAIFLLAALILPGVTLVVAPLVSLIDDQVRVLENMGISRAVGLRSGKKTAEEVVDALLLFVSPERLYIPTFCHELKEIIESNGIDLLVVDEAHSVSEFGHSFRPSYLGFRPRVQHVVREAGIAESVVTIGLTATAVTGVIEDVCIQMGLGEKPIVLNNAFTDRGIEVGSRVLDSALEADAMRAALRDRLEQIDLSERTIIFCTSKGRWARGWYGVEGTVREIEAWANERRVNVSVTCYHGSLHQTEKEENATAFVRGDATVMVATSAFGTGIDIPSVRNVIHLGAPAGLEAWYQESGRAGRDRQGAHAFAIVDMDSRMLKHMVEAEIAQSIGDLRQTFLGGKSSSQGSIARQLQLLVGDDPLPLGVLDPTRGLPERCFLGSFPGWEFEHQTYDCWLTKQVVQAEEARVSIRCHENHAAGIWKAVHRFVLLGVIEPGYERVYARAAPASFELVRTNPEGWTREAMARAVESYAARILGQSWQERIRHALQEAESAPNVKWKAGSAEGRIIDASRAICIATYESIRELRMNSMRAMLEFFQMPPGDEQARFLDTYIRHDKDSFRLIQDVRREDSREVWAWWSEYIHASQDEATMRARIALARSEARGTLLAEYMDIYAQLRFQGVPGELRDELRLPLIRVLRGMVERDDDVPRWGLDQLLTDFGKKWLELLGELGGSRAKDGEVERALYDWARRLPNHYGDTALAQRAVADWVARALR